MPPPVTLPTQVEVLQEGEAGEMQWVTSRPDIFHIQLISFTVVMRLKKQQL
jgi:hypothetical protein